jgi:putative tricarboxylic transport membrane protein
MRFCLIRSALVITALAGSLLVGAGLSRTWATEAWTPRRNVEFIVPTAAGSTMDLLARVIQKIWQEQNAVTVPITVEAKSGAGGALAWTYLSRKEGDGHYIAISGPTLLANEVLHVGDLGYRDMTPIAQLFTEYTVFAVRADGPIKTGAYLVNAMRNSKTLSIGVAPGFGGSNHVAFLKLAGAANIDRNSLTIVPFRGANDSVTALLGGHIDAADATISALAPFLHSGQLRAIAIAAPKRMEGEHADIPTWKEQGFDVVEGNWRGIIGPKNLSPSELAFWTSRVAQLVKSPEWADVLKRYQWDADYADSAGSKRFLDRQFEELKATFANLKVPN